eukprot:g81231.t1
MLRGLVVLLISFFYFGDQRAEMVIAMRRAQRVSMPSAKQIEDLIRAGIPDAEVSVVDARGTGDYFEATVKSASFAGLSKVKQHQAVYRCMGDALSGAVHALQLTTLPL